MFLNPRGMGTKKPPWGGWRVVLGLWFRLCSCQSVGLLVASAGYDVLRFVPPLTVTEGEIDRAVGIIDEVFASLASQSE